MKDLTCYVCGGEIANDIQVLSAKPNKAVIARHRDRCAPGTRSWALKYPDSIMGRHYLETTGGNHDASRAISC